MNHLGNDAKSGLYVGIPGNAHDVRIKSGNGVLDAGGYKFVFADRYVSEDESIRLEFTYRVS